MKNVIVSILFITGMVGILFSQTPPDTLWTKTYGGASSDCGYSVQQTSDEGYIITGYTPSFGYSDVWLIKTDSLGDTLWTKTYDGGDFDVGYSVQQTTDGGYIIAGRTGPIFFYDVYLIKTDSFGDTLWTKTYGGAGSDWGYSVQQTTDGGYIVAGWTTSFSAGIEDVWLIKTDSLGDTLWTKTYGGAYSDWGFSVQQTTDRGYIIAGGTTSFGIGVPTQPNSYLIRTDSLGDILWTKVYGDTSDDFAYSVQQTSDQGYIIAGHTVPFGGVFLEAWLIKTNSFGDTLWTKSYDVGVFDDVAYSVQQTTDGGYIIAGYLETVSSVIHRDVLLIKTNSLGNSLWIKTLGGLTDDDGGYSVQQTSDGGYVVVGYTWCFGAGDTDVWLIKIGTVTDIETPSFSAIAESDCIKLEWKLHVENGCLQYLILKKSTQENEDYSEIARISASGSSPSPKNYFYKDEDVKTGIRYYYKLGVIKENGNTKWYGPVSAVVTGTRPFLSISPNPFTQKTVIRYSSIVNSKDAHLKPCSLRIYDVSGRLVKRFTIDDSRFTEVVWDGKDDYGKQLPSGIYYIKLTQGSLTETRKILLVK